jgi:hypothetical protein
MAATGARSNPPCSATWRGLNGHGVAVAGYDLCPQARIADIIGQTRQACL